MTTDTGAKRPTATRLADEHCHRVTYRGSTVLRCSLCGRLLVSVLAHFHSTHPVQYMRAGGVR